MSKQAVIEQERRRAPIVAGLTILAVVLFFVGQGIEAGAIADASNDSESLVLRADSFGTVLAGSGVRALAFVLLTAPIMLLFTAAMARSDQVLPRYRPLILLGPPLIAVSQILTVLALDSVASDFVAAMPTVGDAAETRAEDLIKASTLFQISGGIGFAGLLGTAFGVVYSALHAMRTGLLTRFWGTLGMAFGVSFGLSFIFGPIGFIGVLIYLIHAALVANGRWFGEQPPAWAAGVAMPWPKPGEEPGSSPRGEEPARPEDFEGSATDVSSQRPARRDNKRKRKRKQRG